MSLLGKIGSHDLFRKILLVVDGSEAGIRAAKFAIMLARQGEAELLAMAVVDTATIHELELSRIFIAEEGVEYEQELAADAGKNLHHVAALAESKKCRIETLLERGSVYGRVVECSMDRDVDLIVIGGHIRTSSRNGQDRLSIEYTRILREARASVLFVKNEDIEVRFKRF